MIGTSEDAGNWPCPMGRTFSNTHHNCIGETCPVWRFKRFKAPSREFTTALKKAQEETGEKGAATKNASQLLAANPDKYGLPTNLGYCGLGGAVE